ncbi:MAG: ABC transporter substrate-binding protein [Acidovorax sp.]|jgi:iron complex transport system substrate-binding protein|nr:ABC transporter substrate-binding protein [Acidovorax sp.]
MKVQFPVFTPRRGVLAALWLGVAMAAAPAVAQVPSAPSAAERAAAIPVLAESARLAPQPITDDRGKTIALAKPPQRIVSLLPSLTESTCALGLCDRLVGVDRYSDWPVSIKKLPVVGGGLDPSVESVVALKPDLVLLSHASKAAERLEALGIKVAALEVKSQAGVHKVLGQLGQLLGVAPEQGAERVWRALQAGVADAAQRIPAEVKHSRVYFEVSRGPYAAGPQSFIGETLTLLGVDNVVPADLGPFPRLSPEFLLRAQPDVILLGNRSMQAATAYPGWNSLKAIKGGHLCVFNDQQSYTIVRPGPRMAEAAHLIAQCLIDKAPRKTQHKAQHKAQGGR